MSIHELYASLARDEARNQMIFDDVLSALEAGRSPVVITERKDHLQTISERLVKFAKNVIVLKGGMKPKERSHVIEALKAIPDTEERVIVATGRYLGEGFDDARLDTLFLTIPISWRGTLAQYAGRLHRCMQRSEKWSSTITLTRANLCWRRWLPNGTPAIGLLATKSLVRESCLPAILRGSRE